MNYRRIESRQNPLIKKVRSLLRRTQRQRERTFLAEGPHLLLEASRHRITPNQVFVREDFTESSLEEIFSSWSKLGVDIVLLPTDVFLSLSDTDNPSGVLGVFPFQDNQITKSSGSSLWLVLDQMRDPGNLGTALRTATAADATGVVLAGESVDLYNPKVVRSAMGAHFTLPVRTADPHEVRDIVGRETQILATSCGAVTPYDEIDYRRDTAIIIGNEAHGISKELEGICSSKVRIPMSTKIESLNASISAGIMLFEACRQRRIDVGAHELRQ